MKKSSFIIRAFGKFKPVRPVHIRAKRKGSMYGAGLRHNGFTYITHSTIHPIQSALQTFTFSQKIFFAVTGIIILLLLFLKPILTVQIIVAGLSFIYFSDVVFGLFLIIKSLRHPREITFDQKEITGLKNKDLSRYSILCPLYKESRVIPQFIRSMNRISYPKKKLDILLLLEEDDTESIKKVTRMKLPSHFRVLVVPHSYPKTKPKACNYGLAHVKGEYLVIYDAEDKPDPLQLKKAFLGFRKSAKNVFCLQAKLNYYNPRQNLLTRFFTAEYSLWFDVTLTGLQSLNTSIPLGGTSNHFRVADLNRLKGWDPFNVTEDADLGIRLFNQGYTTAIFDSETLEEANSKWGNWLRQRSRWIKGYMQTYLVHTRDLVKLVKKTKWHALVFQLVIGGKIAFILINPILWLITISYFTLHSVAGPVIDKAYTPPVLYAAIISLIFGNSLFLFYYMIGCAKKEQWDLIKYIYFVPVYWIMISVAGCIALRQLLLKPHYWEKTNHGFHLQKPARGIIIEVSEMPFGLRFPSIIKNKLARIFSFRL